MAGRFVISVGDPNFCRGASVDRIQVTNMVHKSDSDELAALRAENARLVSLLGMAT